MNHFTQKKKDIIELCEQNPDLTIHGICKLYQQTYQKGVSFSTVQRIFREMEKGDPFKILLESIELINSIGLHQIMKLQDCQEKLGKSKFQKLLDAMLSSNNQE